jgi:hypothetical protein
VGVRRVHIDKQHPDACTQLQLAAKNITNKQISTAGDHHRSQAKRNERSVPCKLLCKTPLILRAPNLYSIDGAAETGGHHKTSRFSIENSIFKIVQTETS